MKVGPRRGRHPSLVACASASACVAIASALPWSRFGAVTRSGYSLASVARQAGVLSGAAQRAVVVGWFLLPLLAALSLAAAMLARPVATPALALACAVLGSVCVAGVLRSPIDHEVGVWLGMAAAVVAAGTAVWAFRGARRPPISHGARGV